MPAFVLQKVLQPVYFAREDTKTPFRFAVNAMVLNALVAIGLAPLIGWIAPAIATTLAGWAMVWQLARGTRRFGDVARFDPRFYQRLGRILLASALMGAATWGVAQLLEPWLFAATIRYLALMLLVGFGATIFFVLSHVTGALTVAEVKAMLKRGT